MASLGSNTAPRAYYVPPLSAADYATWGIKIEMLLIRSELWLVIDGRDLAPVASNFVGFAA